MLALGLALVPAGNAHALFETQPDNAPAGTTPFFYAGGTFDPTLAQVLFDAFGVKRFKDTAIAGTTLVDVPTANVSYLRAWFDGIEQHGGFGDYQCLVPLTPGQRQQFFQWKDPSTGNVLGDSAVNMGNPFYKLERLRTAMGGDLYAQYGYLGRENKTGPQVGVALIDTGVAPVGPLADPNVVIHGPDLSFDSTDPDLAHNDAYGHGTHMAGIIHAVAPQARIIDMKVGDGSGAVDITQVIAAVDWVREHRNAPDGNGGTLNIKVLNLSYGIVSANAWTTDELSAAIDAAWRAGIVVVVSAGNGYRADQKTDPGLLTPAYNARVLAVGAYDSANPAIRTDDSALDFSSGSSSSNKRMPDVAAPGRSIESYRVPGSIADYQVTAQLCGVTATTGDVWYPITANGATIKGSGTSQAAAATSGAAALLISRWGAGATPDNVKYTLRQTATPIANGNRIQTGEGAIDLSKTFSSGLRINIQNKDTAAGGAPLSRLTIDETGARMADELYDPSMYQTHYDAAYATWSAYFGSSGNDPMVVDALAKYYAKVDATRNSTLAGNKDIFGKPFDPVAHSAMLKNNQPTWTVAPDGSEMWNGSAWIPSLVDANGAVVSRLGWQQHPVVGKVWGAGAIVGGEWVLGKWRNDNWALGKWRNDNWELGKWREAGWELGKWREAGWELGKWRDANFLLGKWRDSGWMLGKWRDSDWADENWA